MKLRERALSSSSQSNVKANYAKEEQMERKKYLTEFCIINIILGIGRILNSYGNGELLGKTLLLFVVYICVCVATLIFELALISKIRRHPWLKYIEYICILVVWGMFLIIVTSFYSTIQDEFMRGLNLIYVVTAIHIFGLYVLQSIPFVALSMLVFLIEYTLLFSHESTNQLIECICRIASCFAFILLTVYRSLKERRLNYVLRHQLKESSLMHQRFMDSMKDMVFICTSEGVEYQNPSSKYGILALTKANWVTKLGQITQSRDSHILLIDLIWEYFEHKNMSECVDEEFEYIDLITDQRYILNVSLIECGDSNKTSIAAIVKDITEKRRIEERAIGDKYKNKIMNSVSHEIRTPLNGILGMIQIAKERIKDKEIRMHLGLAESSGFFLKNQLADIEDCAQIVAGKFTLHNKSNCSFPRLLSELEKAALPQLNSKPLINLKISASSNTPQNLKLDKDRICQILSNLLSNAIKYTERGKIRVKCKYLESARRIRVGVKDTGSGIAMSSMDDLFELGTNIILDRGGNNSKLAGLGLNISQMIAAKLGTRIMVESTPGEGSMFYMDLPILDTRPHGLPGPPVPPVPPGHPGPQGSESETERDLILLTEECIASQPYISKQNIHPKCIIDKLILIVDDVPTNRFVLKGLLNEYKTSITIREATNGIQAIQQVKRAVASGYRRILIFMDLDMPIMNGYEAIFHIRRMCETHVIINIIVVSAFTSEKERNDCADLGIQDFLPKPITKDLLIRAIYDHLL